MSDLVSRQAVKNMVNAWTYDMMDAEDVERALHDVDELQDAQQSEGDTVSRKAVIDVIEKLHIPEDMCVFEILSHIELAIGTLPSAQSDITHLQKEQEYMRGWEDGRKNLMEQLPSAEPESLVNDSQYLVNDLVKEGVRIKKYSISVEVESDDSIVKELDNLQTYKFSENDDMTLVNVADVIDILVSHIKVSDNREGEQA